MDEGASMGMSQNVDSVTKVFKKALNEIISSDQ